MARRSPESRVGERYSRWLILSVDMTVYPRVARCRCDCGSERDVALTNVTTGLSRSCGCLARETAARRNYKHGASGSSLYVTWQRMIRRCHNPRDRAFEAYGGRGIYVCERWRTSFEDFRLDMGTKPSAKHSIDRINNDGPYSPENCCWATQLEQMRHTRRTVSLTHNGVTMTASEWARILGVSRQRMQQRIAAGLPDEKLFAPVDRAIARRQRRIRIAILAAKRAA